jgi:hypothetical protein
MSAREQRGIIFPRTAYSLFTVTIPHLKGKALKNAVHNYLVGLYPGELDNKPVAIKKNGVKKGSYLVFVLEHGEIRKPLPVSTLFVIKRFSAETVQAVFVFDDWIEFLLIEKGTLVKSEVKSRINIDLAKALEQFFGSNAGTVNVFCAKEDFETLGNEVQEHLLSIHDADKELKKLSVDSYSLFENLSKRKKVKKCLFGIAALLAVLGIVLVFYHSKKAVEEDIARDLLFREALEKQLEEERKNTQQLAGLRQRYDDIAARKTAGPYETADVISKCLGEKAGIISLTIQDGFFTIEVRAKDSLEVLEAFERNRKVRNPVLRQIHPAGSGERFTLSGTVLPEIEEVNPFLPIIEQIALLERFIGKQELFLQKAGNMSPSAFGANIRSLLKKQGCVINTYQYFNTDNKREIEFSIRAGSAGFFDFLKEASADNGGSIFTIVQIRTGAPGNTLDVVFRVKADTVETAADNDPYEEGAVSQISRNYLAAPQSPQKPAAKIPAEPKAPEQPQKVEQASWIEYIGTAADDRGRFVYVKNTRIGTIIRLEEKSEGDSGYTVLPSGNLEARIDGKVYEIQRRK